MAGPGPRTPQQRKADVLQRLAHDLDVWVATGSDSPHLVPLSLDWIGGEVVLVTSGRTVTARNLVGGGQAQLALGHPRDVVLIQAALARHRTVAATDPGTLQHYEARAGWVPAAEDAVLWLRPLRIRAWREVEEMAGRTLMRDGQWLV